MASPQLENGYTRVANEILEALISHRLSGQEYQIVLFVIRKTYGFGKSRDLISMGQIAVATGINRAKVATLLKGLYAKNILGVTQKDNSFINCLQLSKDHEQWKVLPKKVTVTQKDNTLLPKKVTKVLPKKVHTKEKKESIKKESHPQVFDLAVLLAKRILSNNPKHSKLSNGKYQETVTKWVGDIDKLHRLDKQSADDIRRVIEWSQAHDFWQKNILSGAALRKQFDRLYIASIEKKSGGESWRR